MALKDNDEVTFKLDQSNDGKTMTLTMMAPCQLDVHDLIMILDEYIQDLIRADGQLNQAGVEIQ